MVGWKPPGDSMRVIVLQTQMKSDVCSDHGPAGTTNYDVVVAALDHTAHHHNLTGDAVVMMPLAHCEAKNPRFGQGALPRGGLHDKLRVPAHGRAIMG